MDSCDKTLIIVTLCIVAGFMTVLGFIVGAINISEWAKDNQARRCAEYGYECEKN